MKKIIMIMSLILFITIIICIYIKDINIYSKYKYSQEYIIGEGNIKGNINVSDFINKSKNFDIGANKYGYAVFKNPNKAFKTLKQKYQKGIKIIEKEFRLLPLSKFNYEKYGTYGWQVTIGTEEEHQQARFVSSFIDIYENSYKNN